MSFTLDDGASNDIPGAFSRWVSAILACFYEKTKKIDVGFFDDLDLMTLELNNKRKVSSGKMSPPSSNSSQPEAIQTKKCLRCLDERPVAFFPHGSSWCTVCTGESSEDDE